MATTDKPVKDWTIDEVQKWIERDENKTLFGSYKQIFFDEKITGASLLSLTTQELKDDLKVGTLGERKDMLAKIAALQAAQQQNPPGAVQECDISLPIWSAFKKEMESVFKNDQTAQSYYIIEEDALCHSIDIRDALLEKQRQTGIKIAQPMPCGSNITSLNMLYGDYIEPLPDGTPFCSVHDSSVTIKDHGQSRHLFSSLNLAETSTPIHACIQLPGSGKTFRAYDLAKRKFVLYFDFSAKFADQTESSPHNRYITVDFSSAASLSVGEYYRVLAKRWEFVQTLLTTPTEKLKTLKHQFKEVTLCLVYARIIHLFLWRQVSPKASKLLFFKACQNGQSLVITKIFEHLLNCSFKSVERVVFDIINVMDADDRPVFIYDECGELKELRLDPHPADPDHKSNRLFTLFDPFAKALLACRVLRVHQVICGTNLRLTHFVKQGVLFSPFKDGELDIFLDIEPFGTEGVRNIFQHYFSVTLPDSICSRWTGRARIVYEGLLQQAFVLVNNPGYNGDLLRDISAKEEDCFTFAVAQWKEKIHELITTYGHLIASTAGGHKTSLEELFKKVHRDTWTTNKGQIYDVEDMLLLVDAGIMFLRKNCYELIEKVVVLAICQHFDPKEKGGDFSSDHILQHYLRDIVQSGSLGARAVYDCSWEFFTARLFMLQLRDTTSHLWGILLSVDSTMQYYTFKGRFCVSSKTGLKAHQYIEKLMSSSDYDDTMYLAENFAGGDLILSFIRKPNTPSDLGLPIKRVGVSQAKALVAAVLSGQDYTRAISTTQIDDQYTGKREDTQLNDELVRLQLDDDTDVETTNTKKRKLTRGGKILSGDRAKMLEVLAKYPQLGPWSIGILTIAGSVASSDPKLVDEHRIKLQLGLFAGDSHFGLGLWPDAQKVLLEKFNVLGKFNSTRAQYLYSFACNTVHKPEERFSAIAQIVDNRLEEHLLQPQLGELLGFMCETKKHNGEQRENQVKRFRVAARKKTKIIEDILAKASFV